MATKSKVDSQSGIPKHGKGTSARTLMTATPVEKALKSSGACRATSKHRSYTKTLYKPRRPSVPTWPATSCWRGGRRWAITTARKISTGTRTRNAAVPAQHPFRNARIGTLEQANQGGIPSNLGNQG
jgi:hypothetical protein